MLSGRCSSAKRLLTTVAQSRSTASRELALPVALLSSRKWSGSSPSQWQPWVKRFNEAGYSCQTIDLDVNEGSGTSQNSLEMLEDGYAMHAMKELSQAIRNSDSPFPPLLISKGLDTLIAQTYVSSHPLSGLVLVDPPLTVQQARETATDTKSLQGVQEFDYEPFFPVAILAQRRRAEELERHRLRQDYSEDVELLVTSDELVSHDAFERIQDWMDMNAL